MPGPQDSSNTNTCADEAIISASVFFDYPSRTSSPGFGQFLRIDVVDSFGNYMPASRQQSPAPSPRGSSLTKSAPTHAVCIHATGHIVTTRLIFSQMPFYTVTNDELRAAGHKRAAAPEITGAPAVKHIRRAATSAPVLGQA